MGISKETAVGTSGLGVLTATVAGLYVWGREAVCIAGGRVNGIEVCDRYGSNIVELEDALLRHWVISGSAVLISILGVSYMINGFRKRYVEKKLAKTKNLPYNPRQQNLETSVEQYQQLQEQDLSYQPAQERYQNPTDLETKIAQLRNEIQELESD